MLARIITGLSIVAAIATIIATAILVHQYTDSQQGKWLMNWASPNALMLFVAVVLLALPWLAIWRSAKANKTMSEIRKETIDIKTELQALKAQRVDTGPSSKSPAVGPHELFHAGMIWTWNGHAAQGPACPNHRKRLGYKSSSGQPTQYTGFEENWLNTSGWFMCPDDDGEMFMVRPDHQQVRTLRATVSTRFRSELGIPEPPSPPPTQEETKRRREAGESVFGVTESESGERKQWTKGEIQNMPEAERTQLFEEHPALKVWWLR